MALVIFDTYLHKKLPRYNDCVVCGKENKIGLKTWFFTDSEHVYNNIVISDDYIGYPNRVHGGVVSALVDEAMGWVATVKTGKFYYTIELSVKFKKIAMPSVNLHTKASFKAKKGVIVICTAQIIDENENIVALAEGKYYPLSTDEQTKIESMLIQDY